MGNYLTKTENSEIIELRNETLQLKKEIEDLKNINKSLNDKILLSNNFTSKNNTDLKKFVEEWYEKNNDNIDLGVIDLPFGGSIDVLPDSIEKHLYVKILSLVMELISESKINFMGQEISIAFKQ